MYLTFNCAIVVDSVFFFVLSPFSVSFSFSFSFFLGIHNGFMVGRLPCFSLFFDTFEILNYNVSFFHNIYDACYCC